MAFEKPSQKRPRPLQLPKPRKKAVITLPSPSPASPVPTNGAPSKKTNVPARRRKRPAEPIIIDSPAKHPALESIEDNEKALEEEKEALKYVPLLLFKVNLRARFFRAKGKRKCHGCRVNRSKMPDPPVDKDDVDLLECGCKIEEAIVEEIYVKLGIIGQDVALERKAEGSGWKALGRAERERILQILEYLGLSINNLIELIQD